MLYFFCHKVAWKFFLEISNFGDSFIKLKALFLGDVLEKFSVGQDTRYYFSLSYM